MYGRCKRLFSLTLSLAALIAFLGGCSQPDDIIAPVSSTQIVLTPARLPSPPPGMIYELWVSNDTGAPVSIGKFDWDNGLYRFYDTAGNRIDSVWNVDFDILKYEMINLSVEEFPDPEPDSMGPVMLSDTLVAPERKPVKMVFPIDMWLGTAGFSMTTPTDDNSYSKPASGVWFALYVLDSLRYDDTVDVRLRITTNTRRPLNIDTTWDNSVFPPVIISIDTLNLDSLRNTIDTLLITNEGRDTNYQYVIYLDTFTKIVCTYDFATFPVNVTPDTVTVVDTISLLRHLRNPARDSAYDSIVTLTIAPFTDYIHGLVYDTVPHNLFLDRFLENYEELPNLNGTKWHYKGWVLSPYLAPAASFGTLNRPAWLPGTIDYFIAPSAAPMISTGSFKSFSTPDDGNPYSLNLRVPAFPGEDFLVNLPTGVGPDGIYFADSTNPSARVGTILVTVEPDNFNSDSTNFPLVLLTSEDVLPSYNTLAQTIPRVQNFTLANWYRVVDNDPTGFPAVHVKIVRQ